MPVSSTTKTVLESRPLLDPGSPPPSSFSATILPLLSKSLTRFNLPWRWDGKPAIVQSRATDETGYVQPGYGDLRAVRGLRSIYHNNAIQSWLVQENGEVVNVQP